MGDRLHGFQSPRVMKDDCRMKAGFLYSKEGDGAHARIRTGDLFLTKEVLEDHFPIGAPLRSNAEAIVNNRCLAALPRKWHKTTSLITSVSCSTRCAERGWSQSELARLAKISRPCGVQVLMRNQTWHY